MNTTIIKKSRRTITNEEFVQELLKLSEEERKCSIFFNLFSTTHQLKSFQGVITFLNFECTIEDMGQDVLYMTDIEFDSDGSQALYIVLNDIVEVIVEGVNYPEYHVKLSDGNNLEIQFSF